MKKQKIKNMCHPGFKPVYLNGFRNKFGMTGESGRSMVEMLGVLAIVGVISIGGIAGYIYGMNRYRTNEILDGGNKRAVLVASQLASEITPNLTEFVDYDETAGGTFSSDVERWENEFGIKVSGVKKEVCENLIRMIGDNTPLRGLVNVDGEGEADLNPGECADGTNNNLYLVYNLEMLSNKAVPSGSREGVPPTPEDFNGKACDTGPDGYQCEDGPGDAWRCEAADEGDICVCGSDLGLCPSSSPYAGYCFNDPYDCCGTCTGGKVCNPSTGTCVEPQCTTASNCGTGDWECRSGICICEDYEVVDGYCGIPGE